MYYVAYSARIDLFFKDLYDESKKMSTFHWCRVNVIPADVMVAKAHTAAAGQTLTPDQNKYALVFTLLK